MIVLQEVERGTCDDGLRAVAHEGPGSALARRHQEVFHYLDSGRGPVLCEELRGVRLDQRGAGETWCRRRRGVSWFFSFFFFFFFSRRRSRSS